MSASQKIIVVGGVSGVGKTTISKMLADAMGLPFYDADDFHPKANVEKMKSGQPLNDADRKPWLLTLAKNISKWERERGAVLACSALKESYRELMQQGAELQIIWIFLEGSEQLIADRLRKRTGHFFDPHLLKSQFKAYKRPSYGFYIDVAPAPDAIVAHIQDIFTGKSAFGIVGMGVKGTQLARKLGRMQLKLSIFDPLITHRGDSLASKQIKKYPELAIAEGFTRVKSFIESLESPKRIVILFDEKYKSEELDPLFESLANGDLLITMGKNARAGDTKLKNVLTAKGVHLIYAEKTENGEKEHKINLQSSKIEEGLQMIKDFLKLK